MRIAIMGSGGLGGYFGARLVQGGAAEVHFVARGKHLEAMRAGGPRVEGPEPIHAKSVHATDDPAEIGPADVVMLCVKLWDTEQAIEQIRPMVGPDTAIISFQNGVLKDQYLRAAFDERQLMGGVGYGRGRARPGQGCPDAAEPGHCRHPRAARGRRQQ